MSEERLKIAVFIDFDNIEIGVKKTLNRHFDIGQVLEAIKERGEVVTKIAYGDWKHAADYSRALTQHAVHMVQRNLTPGGDKNGADITLALDALEMAFTRSHINAFVIVGGDSDFIALVEKLKQYDKMVFVVGGRSFTSSILQKNCHEFIAYENLIGVHPAARKSAGRTPAVSSGNLRDALPPLRRALEILADREVSPQLGLLKSTLLQLDSTFSERDYGAHSFREFIQKMANAGFVHLKHVDRSLLVELKDGESAQLPGAAPAVPRQDIDEDQVPTAAAKAHATPIREADDSIYSNADDAAPSPVRESSPSSLPTQEAIAAVRRILEQSESKLHWPMYLRSFKHFLRSADPSFDERRFGIPSIHDLVRQAQREGLLRIERNRQGILRIYPGEQVSQATPVKAQVEAGAFVPPEAPAPEPVAPLAEVVQPAPEPAPESLTTDTLDTTVSEPVLEPPPAPAVEKPKRKRAVKSSHSAPKRAVQAKKSRPTKKVPKGDHPGTDI